MDKTHSEKCKQGASRRDYKAEALKYSKRGEQLPQSINTESDVRLIRELHSGGISMREIGRKFEIHHTTVWRIVNYADWKHVL